MKRPSLSEQKRRLRIMEEFFAHPGWDIMADVIRQEAMEVSLKMGDDPRMTSDVIHFQRGMIRASNELLALPDRMLFKMRSDVQIEESKAPINPAKAG